MALKLHTDYVHNIKKKKKRLTLCLLLGVTTEEGRGEREELLFGSGYVRAWVRTSKRVQ